MPALEKAEQELELRQSLSASDDVDIARSLHDLGVLASVAGQYDRSETLLQRAMDTRRAALGNNDPSVAETLLARIPGLLFLSRKTEAGAAGLEALAIVREAYGEEHENVARAMYWLGVVSNEQIDAALTSHTSAGSYLRDALAIQRRRLGPEHVDIAETMIALGHTELRGNNLASADILQIQGLAMLTDLLGPQHIKVADALYERGTTLRLLGEIPDVIEMLEREISIRSRQFEAHYKLIRCRVVLSLTYRGMGRYEEAIPLARQNVDDHRLLYGEDYGWSFLKLNLAMLHIGANNLTTAQDLLDSVEAHAAQLVTEGVDTYHLLTTINHRRLALSLRAGRFTEAEKYALENMARLQKTTPDGSQSHVRLYKSLAQARAGQGDLSGADTYLDEAVRCFELARTNTGTGLRPATFTTTPYEARAAVRLELGQYEEAWQDLERARGRVLSESLLDETIPFELKRVQASLSHADAIVGWLDHELLPGDHRSWGFVIRSEGPVQWERLPSSVPGESRAGAEQFAAFRDEVAGVDTSAFAMLQQISEETARSLWRQRFGPLRVHLSGVETLIVMPSGAMAGLPIDALMDEDSTYVGAKYAVSHTPSSAIYAWLAEKLTNTGDARGGKLRALLVGDPAFRDEHLVPWTPPARQDAGVPIGADVSVLRSVVRGNASARARLPRLPWSRIEVERVARILPDASLLLGAEASASNLRRMAASGELGQYDIVHLATHSLVDLERPGQSALVLAQVGTDTSPGSDKDRGGVITADEIRSDWKLDARLVTLSACETALGRRVYGEGMVGFAYPLLVAGSRSVLVSLWPVNDEATALLMDRFYTNWLQGDEATTKARALQEAKRWLREWRDDAEHQPYAHPYYWSPFILIGP